MTRAAQGRKREQGVCQYLDAEVAERLDGPRAAYGVPGEDPAHEGVSDAEQGPGDDGGVGDAGKGVAGLRGAVRGGRRGVAGAGGVRAGEGVAGVAVLAQEGGGRGGVSGVDTGGVQRREGVVGALCVSLGNVVAHTG